MSLNHIFNRFMAGALVAAIVWATGCAPTARIVSHTSNKVRTEQLKGLAQPRPMPRSLVIDHHHGHFGTCWRPWGPDWQPCDPCCLSGEVFWDDPFISDPLVPEAVIERDWSTDAPAEPLPLPANDRPQGTLPVPPSPPSVDGARSRHPAPSDNPWWTAPAHPATTLELQTAEHFQATRTTVDDVPHRSDPQASFTGHRVQ
jgi:hypothetical protein